MPNFIVQVSIFPIDSTGKAVQSCHLGHALGADPCRYLLTHLKVSEQACVVIEGQCGKTTSLIATKAGEFIDGSGLKVMLDNLPDGLVFPF